MFRSSIKLKISAALLAGLICIALVCMGLTRFVYDRAMRVTAAQAVRNAQATFEGLERADTDKLAVLVDGLATNDKYLAAFVEERPRQPVELLPIALHEGGQVLVVRRQAVDQRRQLVGVGPLQPLEGGLRVPHRLRRRHAHGAVVDEAGE